jgi:serine/threonine protein kinase
MADNQSRSIGRFFGPYECLSKLGVGGMGSVYQARHRETKAIVALKIASRRVVSEPLLATRFQNEYEAAQNLQHPHLVRALEYGKANGTPYLVMEYVPGMSLDQKIRAKGKLSVEEVMRIARQMGEVLAYLHQHNVIHRDIKPGNILLSETGEAKLADLGLVKNMEFNQSLTRSNTGLGTMEYAAPEQFDNAKNADSRADVYALAATLYKALTGHNPFGRGGQITTLNRKLTNGFTPLAQAVPGVKPCVDRAMTQALQADPKKRPATVGGFMEMLTGGAAAQPAPAVEAPINWRERRVHVRYPVQLASSCLPVHRQGQAELSAVIQDISANGLCLRLPRRFEKGSILHVRVQTAAAPESETTFTVKVCWVKSFAPNTWLLGCEFGMTLSPKELEFFCFDGSTKTEVL